MYDHNVELGHPRSNRVVEAEDLHGVAPKIEGCGAAQYGGSGSVKDVDVHVVCGPGRATYREEGLVPLEGDSEPGALGNRDALENVGGTPGVEVMGYASRKGGRGSAERGIKGSVGRKGTRRECRARAEGAFVGLSAGIASRGEIGDAHTLYRINGLGDDAVLEHWLGEVEDVIHDDIGAGDLHQLGDARGKVG